MRTVNLKPIAGAFIGVAIEQAHLESKLSRRLVRLHFNDRVLVASPKKSASTLEWEWENEGSRASQTYRLSKRGQEGIERRRCSLTSKQSVIDHLLDPVVLAGVLRDGMDATMSLLRELTEHGDDRGVAFNKTDLADSLEAAGYKENENVTDDPNWLNTKDRLGRYIIGQIINCLRMGMPPHPVALKFIAEYESLTK